MPLPTIAFGILLSTLYAAAYHLIRGGTTRFLLLYLILSWVGFWIGDTVGFFSGLTFAPVGVLNAGMGTVFSFGFILAGDLIAYYLRRSQV